MQNQWYPDIFFSKILHRTASCINNLITIHIKIRPLYSYMWFKLERNESNGIEQNRMKEVNSGSMSLVTISSQQVTIPFY